MFTKAWIVGWCIATNTSDRIPDCEIGWSGSLLSLDVTFCGIKRINIQKSSTKENHTFVKYITGRSFRLSGCEIQVNTMFKTFSIT